MFGKRSEDGYRKVLEGISIKTIAYGERSLMSEFLLQKGAALPEHSHGCEQIGYLLSGRIRLHVGGSARECSPGDSWCVPGGVSHRAEILEDSRAIEVFSPARQDYLAYAHAPDTLA